MDLDRTLDYHLLCHCASSKSDYEDYRLRVKIKFRAAFTEANEVPLAGKMPPLESDSEAEIPFKTMKKSHKKSKKIPKAKADNKHQVCCIRPTSLHLSPETHQDHRNYQGYPMSKEKDKIWRAYASINPLLPLKIATTCRMIQLTSGPSIETSSKVQNLRATRILCLLPYSQSPVTAA
eukprot:121721-Amorphochlora_amoeboformis.AAC.1